MIIYSKDITLDSASIGSKTKQLKILKDAGYNVPDFIALPTDTVSVCSTNQETLKECCTIIREKFPKTLYAVRSSALTEDGNKSSMAGQFETKISVSEAGLEEAIISVIQDAANKLTNLHLFSIIVQEYVELEFSGVCFTRNPNGGREMIVESHRGRGEELVSGKINPKQEYFYHGKGNAIYGCPVEIFEHIERHYNFPQDVEWGIKGSVLYLLQTRPITTISEKKYSEIRFLEETLRDKHTFFYEKTEISEIAARPTPFTFSLLQRIYGDGGPVMNVYRKHGIRFLVQPFLVIVGNELYVDHDLETKTLLPSYGWQTPSGPKLKTLRGIWTTITNIFRLVFMHDNEMTIDELRALLEKKTTQEDFSGNVNNFLRAYETVFEINLSAARSLKKLEIMIKKEPLGITDILGGCSFLREETKDLKIEGLENITGNTLEISDTEPLYRSDSRKNDSGNALQWWENLPDWKKRLYEKHITRALKYQNYREYARILMLKYLNLLRESLHKTSGDNSERPYFATLTEIEEVTYSTKLCEERREDYMYYQDYHLPATLSSEILASRTSKGLSAGQITGTIVTEEEIKTSARPRILWTKILSPELTKYFDEIDGIITENGGLLSHLAIIARERGIPVVVTNTVNFHVNDIREIDGGTGEIKLGG